MKSLEWQQFLQREREQSGKVLFTATELANVAGLSAIMVKDVIRRLTKNGVLERYTTGRYGQPGSVMIEDLVPSIDPGAYVTGAYALYRQNFVTQVPRRIHAFTNRRHNRSRLRKTTLGNLVFVCVSDSVYDHPGEQELAGPEQALCDLIYESRRRGVSTPGLFTFRNLENLNAKRLAARLTRYPSTVENEISQLRSGQIN